MDPKSGKPLRLFNPFSIWTNFALKSGEAMLAAAQAAVARPKAPRVAVLPSADAPPPKKSRAARAKTSKAKPKTARKNASSRAKRRGR
jgi:hypothetical protein